MKKIISAALLLALCLSLFAGCSFLFPTPAPSEGLNAAKEYLDSYVKDLPTTTTLDFKVLGVVAIDGVIYPVEWKTDNAAITLERDDENGIVNVVIPACGDVAVSYALTATLSEESGATLSSTYNFTVPVADYVIAAPQVGVAYKLGIFSTAKDDAYYFIGKMKEYYGDTSTAFSKGADVFVEVVEGGYHLYFNDADGAKKYISIVASGTHRNFVFNAETPSVFTFEAQYATFSTMVDVEGTQEKCYMGTSANYYTMGAFNETKIAADTYFAHLYVNDANGGEGETPDTPNTPSVPDPTPDTLLSIKDAFDLGKSKDHNVYTEGKYYIVGEITEVYGTQYGNMYVKDADGNILTIYGTWSADGNTRYDALEVKPVAGDTVKIYGIIGQYNGTPQMKNGWIVEHTPGTGSGTPGTPGTPDTPDTPSTPTTSLNPVAQPEAGKAYKFVFQQNNLDGKLLGITGQMSGNFGSTTTNIADMVDVYLEASGNGFSVYYLNGETKVYLNMVVSGTYVNVGFQTLADNATPTVYTLNTDGKYIFTSVNGVDYYFGSYKTFETLSTSKTEYIVGDKASTIGVSNFCAWFYELAETTTPDDGGETPETPTEPEELTVQEAINKGKAQAQSTYTTEKYYISGVISELSDASKGNFVICDDAGNLLTVYGSFNADGTVGYADMTEKPATGDTVKVLGIVGNYYGTPQTKDAWIVDFTIHTCSYNDATCTEASKCDKCGDVKANALGHTVSVGLCGNCGKTLGESVTASKTIADLITAEGWTSNTTKQSFKLDDVVSVQINGGSNTGKAYNGDHIRIYATDTPAGTITISVPDGYQLVSVKISTLTGDYAFLCVDGTTTDISNASTVVSGASVKLTSVKNGSDGKQVRVTAMEVTYQTIG